MYLVDTGVLSRWLISGNTIDHKKAENIVNKIGSENIQISIINKIELLKWLSEYEDIDKITRKDILKAINSFKIFNFNSSISKMVNDEITKYPAHKVADIIIGCTAIYYNLVLCTINTKDFTKLKVKLL